MQTCKIEKSKRFLKRPKDVSVFVLSLQALKVGDTRIKQKGHEKYIHDFSHKS
jgi:hypothetical protein